MANFVVTVDADAARQATFLEAVEPRVGLMDGLVRGACRCGPFAAVWATEPRAPVSVDVDGDAAGVIWGEAIDMSSPSRLTARDVTRERRARPGCTPTPRDGFHATVGFDPESGVMAWADLLGLFPLYYMVHDDGLLLGSSPELFRYHPEFRGRLDLEGLVGMLLTMHLIGGRTLLAGVRRLAAGHALAWHPRRGARELPQYRLPVSRHLFDLPLAGQVKSLEDALADAVSRHVLPDSTYGLLLSGGRDSRLLAGLVCRVGLAPVALTLGLQRDLEMQCACAVARTLGLEHHAGEVAADRYVHYADLEATWEHGAQGFNTIDTWGVLPLLRDLPPRLLNAYVADSIVGGSHVTWAYAETPNTMSFEAFFERIQRWGIRSSVLRRLLRPRTGDGVVEAVIQRIRALYEGYSDLESQRAWCFDLHHRQRFHTGGHAWRLSFGAWPVLPFVDHRILDVAGSLPAASLAARRLQDQILCEGFPELAELPLDRNDGNTEPLRPRLRRVILHHLASRVRAWGPFATHWPGLRPDRLRYHRLYDLNGPPWMAVRRKADKQRERVLDLFDPDRLAEVLPPAPARVSAQDGIADFSGPKTIIGFLLWSRHYLA